MGFVQRELKAIAEEKLRDLKKSKFELEKMIRVVSKNYGRTLGKISKYEAYLNYPKNTNMGDCDVGPSRPESLTKENDEEGCSNVGF